MKRYDLSSISIGEIVARSAMELGAVESAVADIIADVRARGDAALLDYTERFDGVRPETLTVTPAELKAARDAVEPGLYALMQRARDNIEAFHKMQLPRDALLTPRPGVTLGIRNTPIARAGVYVPGGTAAYPSSVLMNVIPAKLAGVGEIVMATPPQRDGSIPPVILAAAQLAGVDTILRAGGAQAIAALAYGTQTIPKVYKITGPGNIYVATAKRQVYGLVDIDMIAGPSEILVLADAGANAAHVAADLLSQAEHDARATAVLITDSAALLEAVEQELARQLALLPRRDIAAASLESNGKLILAPDLEAAVEASNAIAPEHLELCVRDPLPLMGRVNAAGSIFMGYHTPEAVGDYLAGANHILPTGGAAHFASALCVEDFMKKSQFISYDKAALNAASADIAAFARAEGLEAHARSVLIRKEDAL